MHDDYDLQIDIGDDILHVGVRVHDEGFTVLDGYRFRESPDEDTPAARAPLTADELDTIPAAAVVEAIDEMRALGA